MLTTHSSLRDTPSRKIVDSILSPIRGEIYSLIGEAPTSRESSQSGRDHVVVERLVEAHFIFTSHLVFLKKNYRLEIVYIITKVDIIMILKIKNKNMFILSILLFLIGLIGLCL